MDNKAYYHKDLAQGRWAQMSLIEQMANIGSEVHRTVMWIERGQKDRMTLAFYRALELIDLTIAAQASRPAAIEELCRLREFFCGIVLDMNLDELKSLDKDFDAWGLAYSHMRSACAPQAEAAF